MEVRDDEGTLITLKAPAQRIVSLAPSLTELIYAAGAFEKLVGVAEYSDFPPAAKELPIVGRFDILDIERIVQLNPDLVVAWQSGNPRTSVNRLRKLGLPVYIAEPKSLASIPFHIERLALLAGTKLRAEESINGFRQKLKALHNQFSHQSPVPTYYQVWDVWLAAGYLDKAVVMNYTKNLKDFAANIDIMYDNLPTKYRKKIIMGIATYNQSARQVVDKVKYTRVTRFKGISFFSYNVMVQNPRYFKSIKKVLYPRG